MIEKNFDIAFTASLAMREKQVQQSYRPIIGIHKWFARRPGTVFRSLLLAEYYQTPVSEEFWKGHALTGVVADPFMGGGTPVFEASRLGLSVVGTDVNPMAHWIVRQALAPLNLAAFSESAAAVVADVGNEIDELYETTCAECGDTATVKYFLWVKTETCPSCHRENDLFPGFLLAKDSRHPRNVLACQDCGELNEFSDIPTADNPAHCRACGGSVQLEGPAVRGRCSCRYCSTSFAYPQDATRPPTHRMWAIEYHCRACKPGRKGRFFKKPDVNDLERYSRATQRLASVQAQLPIPDDPIPTGDETNRLHRWGYHFYRTMFGDRQLLGLGLLLRRIQDVKDEEVQNALLTVFSDFLRYQNLLCRYDTYALKVQDIFSVHGFPVGLIQCENNLLGIPGVGSGSYRHFVEKYLKAKRYAQAPHETSYKGGKKKIVKTPGEEISAPLVSSLPASAEGKFAFIKATPATEMPLGPNTLDGVFTDPPYFDNVQYAELMDFCYVWLRLGLQDRFESFRAASTRSDQELTGNVTRGRDLEHFTAGLSSIFQHYSRALKPGAPFVFTYHHNDPEAYVPLVVAILDAGMDCTATLPAPAEMGASLHINGTGSSVLDSVFVCRSSGFSTSHNIEDLLHQDIVELQAGGVRVTEGDIRCLAAGHVARIAINQLRPQWNQDQSVSIKMEVAARHILEALASVDFEELIRRSLTDLEAV